MFQAAIADTYVIDDPDAGPTAQQLSEEVVPHIIIIAKVAANGEVSGDGARHKLTPDRSTASCGMQYHAGFDYLVPESLEGDLCQNGCFPPFELEKAAKATATANGAHVAVPRESASAIGKRWLSEPTPPRVPRITPRRKK